MEEEFRTDIAGQIINEIISEWPLNERTAFAYMNKDDAEILQRVFDLYVQRKIGSSAKDDECSDIMNALLIRLRETHRLRIVK